MPGLLSACAGAAVKDAQPTAVASPTQPDGYPNLNIPALPAAPQLTDEERARIAQELSNARGRQNVSPAPSAEERERLRRLAQRHAEERLREIEATE